MTFFLRKAYSFGPVRLNLSKSGLGLSAGVTGARVGVGPRGAYLAGGRHGLYYRESMSSLTKKGQKASQTNPGEVRLFVDTGLTYHKGINLSNRTQLKEPAVPIASTVSLSLSLTALLLFFIGPGSFMLFAFVILLIHYLFTRFNAKNAKKAFENITAELERKGIFSNITKTLKQSKSKLKARYWLEFNVFKAINAVFYESPDYISPQELVELEQQISISKRDILDIKAEVFGAFLDEVMKDHVISKEEETELENLQKSLRLEDAVIVAEKQMIQALAKLRDTLATNLTAIQPDINLKQNEVCFFKTKGSLLKEKIINQYQRNRVVYKESGYDIDLEGTIFLTDSRIVISDNGERSYVLSRVKDITLSLEDNTVQVLMNNLKNPLIFSTPEITVFAAMLQKLTGSED